MVMKKKAKMTKKMRTKPDKCKYDQDETNLHNKSEINKSAVEINCGKLMVITNFL